VMLVVRLVVVAVGGCALPSLFPFAVAATLHCGCAD